MVRTYVVLLFLVLGFCPDVTFGTQQTKELEPPKTPILPAEQAWRITLPFAVSGDAAMDDHRAYIPLQGEHLIAIERETGATVWTADIESVWPPLVHGDLVLLAASDELHALDSATGARRWRVDLGHGAMAPMALIEDRIVVLVAPDEVRSFRAADGQQLWATRIDSQAGRGSMAVTATSVFVALGSRLVGINAPDGVIRWTRTLSGTLMSPAVSQNRVIVGSTTNEFYAFDAADASLEWKWRVGGDVIGITASMEIAVISSLDNVVRAVRPGSGNQTWKRPLTTRPTGRPDLFEGVVAISTASSFTTFDLTNGAPIATFDAAGLLQGSPLIDSTPTPYAVSIITVMRDGRVAGLRPVELLFRERVLEPISALPGRVLTRDALPQK